MRRVREYAIVRYPAALRRLIGGWLAAFAGVALTTTIMGAALRFSAVPNISLLYLFPIVAVAGVWGRWPAIGGAVLASLSYDWFFVQPVHTFTVEDPAGWLALVVLLAAAVFTANLTAALRQQAEEAHQRAREAGLLRTLASTLAEAHDLPELLDLGRQQAITVLGVTTCRIDLAPSQPPALDIASDSLSLPLRTPRGLLGEMRLTGFDGPMGAAHDVAPLLSAFAAQLALAIERVGLQEAATQAEVLRRTDVLRGALLSAVSHDLRTPLAAIKAAATSLLQRDVEWSEAEREGFAQSVNRGVDRLNRLVANLLDLSRIEAGALRLDREAYLLEDLIAEATDQAAVLFAPGQVRTDLPTDPAALPWVEVDPTLMVQVLVNLLENAAKYAPGSPVTVRARRVGADAIIEVEDTGPGIGASQPEQLFDRFYRGAQRQQVAGAGVGLAVCKGIVEAHGGRIWARSREGGGAVFTVAIPALATPPLEEI